MRRLQKVIAALSSSVILVLYNAYQPYERELLHQIRSGWSNANPGLKLCGSTDPLYQKTAREGTCCVAWTTFYTYFNQSIRSATIRRTFKL